MKVFVAICFVAFVAVAQALTDKEKSALQGFYKVCVEESKVDEESIKKMRAGETIEDDKLNHYVYCMFKKVGFINDKDEVQEDTIKAKGPGNLSAEDTQKVIDTCRNVKGKNINETTFKLYACFVKTGGKPIEF